MRTSEERPAKLHRRMEAMREARDRRRYLLVSASACTACLAAAILLSVVFSRIQLQPSGTIGNSAAASAFSSSALGFVVTAVIAFFLGAFVTVFCFRIKKHLKDPKRDDD